MLLATAAGAQTDPALAAARKDFTANGKPINPLIIQELLPLLSDGGPGPIAIDLASQDSNRYFGTFAKDKNGVVTIELKTTQNNPKPDENYGYFSYKRLGTLPNGIDVLETWANGGGTGVFTDLLLVRIGTDFEYDDKGARKTRLIITRMGEIALGDRYAGTVSVKGDAISIGAGGVIEKPTTIRIQ